MSVFTPPAVSSNADMKKIKNYILMLNQQLRYCLSNIDPEDNFSLDAMVKYQETDTKIAQLEVSMSGFISEFKNLETSVSTSIKQLEDKIVLKVSANELCSEISMSSDTINFKSGYITIDAKNFTLDETGAATFSGNITGGSININNKFIVDSTGHTEIASGAYTGKISCAGVLATETLITYGDCSVDGSISCNSMSVDGSVTCETLYEDSDRRLKENIVNIPDHVSLELVLGLRPVAFTYRASGERSMGYIAQEVVELQQKLGYDLPLTAMRDGYYAIPYSSYGALYAGAIRHQQKQLDELEKRIKEKDYDQIS